MRCDDVVLNLPDFVLGKVEPNLMKSIEDHVETCAKCKAELRDMHDAIEMLGGAGQDEYPDEFWHELRASIMEKVGKPTPARWRVPALASGLVIVLVAIGIGVYEYTFKSPQAVQSVSALASSLPPDQVVELPSMNLNYVNVSVPQISEAGEMDDVGDSLQQAVIKSMWVSIADSTSSFGDFDYLGNTVSN